MKVNRQELLRALEIVSPGLSTRESIEQSTSFAFMKGRVVTYNDEISISHPVEGMEDLQGVVEARLLKPLLNKLTADEVEITLDKDSQFIIKAKRAKAGLAIQSEIRLPLAEVFERKGKWKPLPEGFMDAVKFVMTAAGKDLSSPILMCVHVNANGYVEASDTYRLAYHNLSDELKVNTFLFLASSAVALSRVKEINQVAEGEGWIHFRNEEGTEFSCRLMDDVFPSTGKLLKLEGTSFQLPANMEKILDRAMVIAKQDIMLDENVEISLEKKRFKLRAECDTGWFEEIERTTYDGEKISFNVTPYLLKSILKETTACTLSGNRILFEGDKWKYVAMLRI